MLRGAVIAVGLSGILAAAEPAVAQTLTPRPCEPGWPEHAVCSTLTVPLDRGGATPGTLDLPVRVLPARSPTPRGPFLLLSGGPGQAGIDPASGEQYADLAPDHDYVSYDQRGTGATALRCGALEGEALGEDDLERIDGTVAETTRRFARCAEQIGPTRRFYTSADSAADIDDLRAALGAERITIGGISYGTWVSQVYARMFPGRVERIVLDSVVGPNGVAGIALSEYAGARRILRAQCARGACRRITRSLLADATRLAARLDDRPLSAAVVTTSGRRRRVTVGGPSDPGLVSNLFYAGDLDPLMRATLPAAVASALRGDPALLLRVSGVDVGAASARQGEDPAENSAALNAATTCAETVFPWAETDPVELRREKLDAAVTATPAGELAPWGPTDVLAGAAVAGCLEWPDGPFASPPPGPLPDVPALVLGGLLDVRTPIEDSRAVAAQLPQSTLVEVPNRGHAVLVLQCAQRALSRFLAGRPVGTRACANELGTELVPVPPRSLAAVGPRGSGPLARARRSIRATRLAIRDALTFETRYPNAPRFPGLRGGTAGLRGPRRAPMLVLRRYVYAPGLSVSGRLRLSRQVRGRLRVAGPRAARGALVVRRGIARGRLGGVGVVLRLLTPAG